MAAATPVIQFAVDNAGRLNCDLPCAACDHNLRLQPTDGVCPECGVSIADTLRVRLLRFSDPRWLRRCVNGLGLMILGAIVAALLTICLAATEPVYVESDALAGLANIIRAITIVAVLAASAGALYGAELFRRRTPRKTCFAAKAAPDAYCAPACEPWRSAAACCWRSCCSAPSSTAYLTEARRI